MKDTVLLEFVKNYFIGFMYLTSTQVIRYIVIAGGACLFVLKGPPDWIKRHRIQDIPLRNKDLVRELKDSVVMILIYGAGYAVIFNATIRPYTRLYFQPDEMGWLWKYMGFVVLLLIHDTYFYWTHRLLHLTKPFQIAHKTHHLSTNPSPFTSQAFHPIESFVAMVWIIPVVFIIPIYRNTLLFFGLFSLLNNVYGHLSVEIIPERWKKFPLIKWISSSVHHNWHHKHYHGNYGLYFLFWDRLMKTERYYEKFTQNRTLTQQDFPVSS